MNGNGLTSKRVLRIVVPILIVVAVAGMWLMKDHQQKQEKARQLAVASDPAFVLEESTFDLAAYQAHNLPLILDFGAEECGPCQQMRPDLEKAHQETLGKAVIKFFDVWKRPELAADYPVRVVPTQVFMYPDGSPYVPGDKVREAGIQFSTYSHRESGEHALTVHEGILTLEDLRLILQDMGMAS